jgi:hypothetical protein
VTGENNNEGHARGDDGEDPPHVDIEKSHAVSRQERNKIPSRNDSRDSKRPHTVVYMEIDKVTMPKWVALRIVESQIIAEDLAQEKQTSFEEQSLTLHNAIKKRKN